MDDHTELIESLKRAEDKLKELVEAVLYAEKIPRVICLKVAADIARESIEEFNLKVEVP